MPRYGLEHAPRFVLQRRVARDAVQDEDGLDGFGTRKMIPMLAKKGGEKTARNEGAGCDGARWDEAG